MGEFRFVNNGLSLSKSEEEKNTYLLTGTITNQEKENTDKLGFSTQKVFALKFALPYMDESSTVRLKGSQGEKYLTQKDFDGVDEEQRDFVYLVLDGTTPQYTITVDNMDGSRESFDLIIKNDTE